MDYIYICNVQFYNKTLNFYFYIIQFKFIQSARRFRKIILYFPYDSDIQPSNHTF